MFEGIPVVGLTAPTLLGMAIMLLLTGKLWTNAAYQEKNNEAERWRKAYENEREARLASDKQTEELLELSRTTNHLMQAVFSNSRTASLRQSGGTNVAIQSPGE